MKPLHILTTLIGIGAIVYLEHIALKAGVDGTALSISVAAISGMVGYNVKEILNRFKK